MDHVNIRLIIRDVNTLIVLWYTNEKIEEKKDKKVRASSSF